MKKFTKYAAALLVLCMIFALVPAAYAAEYTAEPAQTVNVTFKVKDILGIDGSITVDDPDGIVSSSKIVKVNTTMSGDFDASTIYYYSGDLSVCSFELTYEVQLSKKAEEGDKCTVTFTYEITDTDYNLSEWIEKSHTVVVTAPAETEPAPTESAPTEPAPTEPAPTEPAPTEPVPTQPAIKIEYTKLEEQLGIADSLDGAKYTEESWNALESALKDAQDALNSNDQSTVDDAADALETAIGGLVALDFSALEAAIEKVEGFLMEDSIGSKAKELISALESVNELLNSKDQATIDSGTVLLETLLEELQKSITDMTKVEEIIKEIEKIVEVEPTEPYCNISIHYVWPILFFISLLVNITFVVLTVVYFVRRKNEKDDTPLVDYDIGDDTIDENAE